METIYKETHHSGDKGRRLRPHCGEQRGSHARQRPRVGLRAWPIRWWQPQNGGLGFWVLGLGGYTQGGPRSFGDVPGKGIVVP